jgi:hypothetical protein
MRPGLSDPLLYHTSSLSEQTPLAYTSVRKAVCAAYERNADRLGVATQWGWGAGSNITSSA